MEDVTFSPERRCGVLLADTVFRGIKRFTKYEVALCAK